ncbi:unnamed protein product, partial [Closterium sp. NIES-54]
MLASHSAWRHMLATAARPPAAHLEVPRRHVIIKSWIGSPHSSGGAGAGSGAWRWHAAEKHSASPLALLALPFLLLLLVLCSLFLVSLNQAGSFGWETFTDPTSLPPTGPNSQSTDSRVTAIADSVYTTSNGDNTNTGDLTPSSSAYSSGGSSGSSGGGSGGGGNRRSPFLAHLHHASTLRWRPARDVSGGGGSGGGGGGDGDGDGDGMAYSFGRSGSGSDSPSDSMSGSGWETAGVAPGMDIGDNVEIKAAAAEGAGSSETVGARGAVVNGGGVGGGAGGAGAAGGGAVTAVHPAATALQALALASLPPPSVVPSIAAPLVSVATAALASLTAVPAESVPSSESESPPSQSPPSQSPPSQSPPSQSPPSEPPLSLSPAFLPAPAAALPAEAAAATSSGGLPLASAAAAASASVSAESSASQAQCSTSPSSPSSPLSPRGALYIPMTTISGWADHLPHPGAPLVNASLAADVIADMAADVAKRGGIPSEPLLGAPWSPDGRKYLLALCSTGGMSNHLFCLREFALLAGALNRTLVVPMGPHELTLPLSLVFDVPFLRACYGPKTALTLDEYKQFVGRGSMEVTHMLCLVKGCHLVPDAAPGGQFKASKGRISLANVTVPAVEQWVWSGLPDKHSLQAFLKVYSRVPNGVLVIGEFKKQPITDSIFFRMLAPMDLPFLLPSPPGKQRGRAKPAKVVLRDTCLASPAIRPPEPLIAAARHIVQRHLLSGQFLAVQFRRGDFKDYCRKKHPSDGCFLPVEQAAQCMRAAALAARVPLVFLATNARPHEVAAIAATLLETPQEQPLEVAATVSAADTAVVGAAAAAGGGAAAATVAAAVEQEQPSRGALERRLLSRFADEHQSRGQQEEMPLPPKEPRSLQAVAQPSGRKSQPLDPRSQRSMPAITRRMLPGGSSGVEASLHDEQPANTSSGPDALDGSSSAVQLVTLAHLLSKEDSSMWLQPLMEN